jgi:hypothetical protein
VSRQADCGPAEARARAKIARKYLEMAELTQTEDLAEAKNVAAGNPGPAGKLLVEHVKVITQPRDQ